MAINYREREDQTIEFLDFLSQYTTMSVDIHLIKHDGLFDRSKSLRFTVAQNVKLNEVFRVLKRENLWWKNDKRLENVYWSWSKNQKLNIAFVDDITETEKFKSENHLALIQTSKSKYQGLFLLDQYVSDEELKIIQRILVETYQGDTGALSPYQLKRLVGFVNTKYSDEFVVRLDYKGSKVLSLDEVLDLVKKKEKTNSVKQDTKTKTQTGTKIKTWIDFDTGDESQTDMKYALYLMSQGYTDEEVKDKLLIESRDIHSRKGQYVDDYLNRTIQKARLFFSQNQQTPKPMKKPKGFELER